MMTLATESFISIGHRLDTGERIWSWVPWPHLLAKWLSISYLCLHICLSLCQWLRKNYLCMCRCPCEHGDLYSLRPGLPLNLALRWPSASLSNSLACSPAAPWTEIGVLPGIAFSLGSQDLNSAPLDCTASALPLWAIPQTRNMF